MNSQNNLPDWKTVVIKVGSSLVAPDGMGCSTRYLLNIARLIQDLRSHNKNVVLVSSGSVAAGMAEQAALAKKAHRSIAEKQALAAIGQTRMIAHWQKLFDFQCGQILLTRSDFDDRKRFLNARNTFETLLELGVLPIVNENDSVAVEEIKVGDNDNLAAQVALMVDADLFVMLSDVNGLYNADPGMKPDATLLDIVENIDSDIIALAGDSQSVTGTGGMHTKLQAAGISTSRGIHTIVANGRHSDALDRLLQGINPGTWFKAANRTLSERKHWMLHTQKSVGKLVVDAGASIALQEKGASLLPRGIVAVEGDFRRADRVDVVSGDGQLIACGLCQYDGRELNEIKGLHSSEIRQKLGYFYTEEAIHRDDLVLY